MNNITQELIEQKLYELMEEKPSETLTDEEKEFVATNFSESEYVQQRNTMLDLFDFEKEAQVTVKESSSDLFDQIPNNSNSKASLWVKTIRIKIPAYASAASVLVAVLITSLSRTTTTNQLYSGTTFKDSLQLVASLDTGKSSLPIEITKGGLDQVDYEKQQQRQNELIEKIEHAQHNAIRRDTVMEFEELFTTI
jgi:hypothetical protein